MSSYKINETDSLTTQFNQTQHIIVLLLWTAHEHSTN
jgi:hypothetical protein